MSAADGEAKPEEGEKAAAVAGELLYCGGTDWESMGRKTGAPASSANLVSPTRLRPLVGVDIRFVASGCTSCHCVALDVQGCCYTWGRNKKGQLGHGDTVQRNSPTIVSELSKYKIIRAGAGRNHTVVVTDDGKSFSFGINNHGQLGSGSLKKEIEPSPVPCLVSQATTAVCGADFTVWLSSVEGSSILTAGLPQYGQLGHGTDNEYNSKEASVRLAYEPQPCPRAIAAFSGKAIVKVACGVNHTIAVDSNGFVYTWGYGGYGRLGHRGQKDEWVPRLVEVFQKYNALPPTAVVSAGSLTSAFTAGGGQLYMCGKLKNAGDEWMYPKPLMDLSGWNIRCMTSGYMHHAVGADSSCISWGYSQNGELGYGPLGQKSSANPKKIDILDGMHVTSVACGLGLSLIVVDRASVGDQLEQLEVYDGETLVEGAEEIKDEYPTPTKGSSKNGAPNSSANSKKRKKHKASSESEDEEPGSEDGETANGEAEGTKGRRSGKPSSRGRGRGAKKAATELKVSGRARDHPKSANKSSGQEAEKSSSGRGRGRGKSRKRGESRR